jgi:hypothetical protein
LVANHRAGLFGEGLMANGLQRGLPQAQVGDGPVHGEDRLKRRHDGVLVGHDRGGDGGGQLGEHVGARGRGNPGGWLGG